MRTIIWNVVPWYVGSGEKIRAVTDADISASSPGNAETELSFGQTYARPAGVEHNIVNPNAGEFRFVEIELK